LLTIIINRFEYSFQISRFEDADLCLSLLWRCSDHRASAAFLALRYAVELPLTESPALRNKKLRALQIANIDSMTGVQFEQYLQKLLYSRGYRVSITRVSGDLGVDLIACRAQDRIAIQVKRHNAKVSRRAISDAVAGMQHYRCNRAMVITNSHFTPGAITLARSTSCTLVNRDLLVQWILQFQAGKTRKA
jgi:HJR/Mrr/RecB family endonuclease